MWIAVVIVAGLLAAGCGGEDAPDAPPEPAGAEAEASSDMTVGEFIAELQPEKQRILEAFVDQSRRCEGVEVDNGFVLLVSAAAIDADQDAPLAGLVEDQC